MPVTAFVHHKGGVGTTMLVQLLAAELAGGGRRVLAVDLDPQGNLSRRMGYQEHQLDERLTTAEVVKEADPQLLLDKALLPCQWEPDWAEQIDLVPARLELENRVPEAGIPGSWRRLHRALDLAREKYDDVLIDVPPTLGHLFDLASCAADYVILPTTPTYDGIRGAKRIIRLIDDRERRVDMGLRAQVIGIVINGKRAGVRDHTDRIDQALRTWGDMVWSPHITLRAGVAGADERAEPPQIITDPAGPMIRLAAEQLTRRYLQETTE